MGFGFVVAHFGIFADEPQVTQQASGARPHELSLWFGAALVAIGVTVNLCSAWAPDHGVPVRAIVPGHYGMASVKWLTRIQAVREPFHGYWQTSDYAYWASMGGKLVRRALGEMQLKSEIARPRVYETLVSNRI